MCVQVCILTYFISTVLQIIGEPGFGGSHTPSMVGAIQSWRKTLPQEAELLWSKLQQSNTDVESGLRQLKTIAKEHFREYKSAIEACEKETAEQVLMLISWNLDNHIYIFSVLNALMKQLLLIEMRTFICVCGVLSFAVSF